MSTERVVVTKSTLGEITEELGAATSVSLCHLEKDETGITLLAVVDLSGEGTPDISKLILDLLAEKLQSA